MNSPLLARVTATIQKHEMLSKGDNVLVGLSGGPDSTCLLMLMKDLQEPFGLSVSAVYVDHGLRPAETPAEISFCRELCASLSLPFHTRTIDLKPLLEKGMNRQEAGRELRYEAFAEVAVEIGSKKIAVGHTADDQAETVVMRLVRGSGPSGLAGIPPVRAAIIRPLIETSRKDVEGFLASRGVTPVTDSSNLKEEYVRNRIRYTVMPHLKALNPDLLSTMGRTATILRDEERYLEFEVTKTLIKLISRKSDTSIELFTAPLETLHTAILRRLLRRALDAVRGLKALSLDHIEAIIGLIKRGSAGSRVHLPGGVRAVKGYATLVITAVAPARVAEQTLVCPGDTVIRQAGAVIRCSVVLRGDAADLGDGKRKVCLDADTLALPLSIRARRPGDSFIPLGLGKHKKLQDFFVDEKVPRDERDAVPLLVSGEDIVWIAGYRVDDRYKVTDNTTRVLRLELHPVTC